MYYYLANVKFEKNLLFTFEGFSCKAGNIKVMNL